ncbi:hypothetical protein [Spirosoma montaniterrae]|uniref:DUF4034 domain-containing protein n=1 Tax=Spirosoma montaniterrae TaxID=1178516 RepID=A0A1P9WU68_9BACT|nr:hypothetical protein [Spirosoma montaniterrae]AQG78927.1 hypothetical protein AWR27_06055 [Spirosoma montaniterrae]
MPYLSLFTDQIDATRQVVGREFRLDELVGIYPLAETAETGPYLTICDQQLAGSLPWDESLPPVLLPRPLTYSSENLLALVFMHLGNWEKAYEYSQHDRSVADALDLTNRLQQGVPVPLPTRPVNGVGTFGLYQGWHNRAVVLHYGYLDEDVASDALEEAYQMAIRHSPDPTHRAFTSKHFATYLLDSGQLDEASRVLSTALENPQTPETARVDLLAVQYAVWLQQLTVPYDPALLDRTKAALWTVLQTYETEGRTLQTGLLLVDAAQVANFQNSFAEALGYINRAIGIFREEEAVELLANAQYRKGVLLYTWAQHGSPQFYRPAMEAYQEALKVFTQENAPAVFAEIQHHLGVIYSEVPDEAKKKSIWAAVSSSSFQQALTYFTKEQFPYEYATICNHYANALTKYPPAARSDNYAKAITYYREALRIRTAETYPYERALTILNYLEAGWYVGEDDPGLQRSLLNDLIRKAQEVETLVSDEPLLRQAQTQLDRLQLVSLD